jgi:hypothetical protein
MNVLIAVFKDLAHFAITTVFGTPVSSHSFTLSPGVWHMDAPKALPELPTPYMPVSTAPHTLHQKALDEVFAIPPIAPQRNTIVYTATSDAPLRSTPHTGIDNLIRRIPYGAMLVALETQGSWVRVFHLGTEGWVSLDDVVDRAGYVYPKFIIGEDNTSSDPNTERVRAMIHDEFCCGEGDLPLQAEEYVLYKLVRAGARISWGETRPRIAGTWADTVETSHGAVIGTEPKARSVMEWRLPEGRGHVAFVENVFDDSSIQISEANWPERGIWNERVLVKEEWEALSPRFISFA